MKKLLLLCLALFVALAIHAQSKSNNPLFPGWYADPNLITLTGFTQRTEAGSIEVTN